jgi:hypothetical protein
MRGWKILGVVLTALPCSMIGQNDCVGDVNNDMTVNLYDILLLLTHYGDSCTVVEPVHASIQISEIHYNPSSLQGNDSDWEFLELHNLETHAVSLFNWSMDSGVTKTFEEQDSIPAQGFFVIARNADSLLTMMPPTVHWCEWNSGQSLNNTGETITLRRWDGSLADQVMYEDSDGWMTAPDGMGPSLEWMDTGLPNESASSWGASFTLGGTPGIANSMWGLSEPE